MQNILDQMSDKIRENIKIPGYVDNMEPDFTTSTGINRIVSQIMLMNSVQEYFAYSMVLGCGIPYVDMKGTEEDWIKLGQKVKTLRKTLEPIHRAIGLDGWWGRVEGITDKLLETFRGNPDEDWWSKVIAENIGNAPSGLVSVPMTITDGQLSETAAVVAGMVGYNYYDFGDTPTLEPVHGWSLLLEEDSFFRSEMTDWEDEEINGIL